MWPVVRCRWKLETKVCALYVESTSFHTRIWKGELSQHLPSVTKTGAGLLPSALWKRTSTGISNRIEGIFQEMWCWWQRYWPRFVISSSSPKYILMLQLPVIKVLNINYIFSCGWDVIRIIAYWYGNPHSPIWTIMLKRRLYRNILCFFLLNMKCCVDFFDLFQMLLSATDFMSLLVTARMKVQLMLLHFRVCCTLKWCKPI